jgi:imidazolonepropionase-like amidohydrolase
VIGKITGIWLSIITLVAAADTHAMETTRYVLLTADGKKAGEQVVERAKDGLTTIRYIFKDNGRGPELVERLHVAPDGTLADYEVKGQSTMGGPVDDHFVRTGDKAEWRSTSERGSTTIAGPALYIPLNSSFEIASMSIGALAARPDGKLPLLPSGTLTQRTLAELDVVNKGQSRRVQLLAQTGLGLTPSFYWATPGQKPRLFAAVFPGYMTAIEEGWESNSAQLEARQKLAEGAMLKELASSSLKPLHGLTIIRNARIFDSETTRLGANSDIYVLRGRITAIVPAGSHAHKADNEIDAAGRIALPGLFDMHGHIDRWQGGLHLAAGITTVRDMGNNNVNLQQMLDEIAAGKLLSPQIVPCGFLEGESPFSARNGFVIKTLQEAKDAVDWYAARGYPQLKIYNSFPREMVREIVAYAHQRGMKVSGHVPAFMRAQEVVEQGYDEIQHINQVMLNFLVSPTTDTRTLERFYLPAEKLAGLDLDAKPVLDFIELLKQRKTVIDPTVTTFDFIKQRDGELSEPYAAVVKHLPPDVQRGFYVGEMKIPDDATASRYKASYAKMIDFIGRLYKAGIPIVAGTDAFAGFTLHSELELYVKAGLTPVQALQIATRNGALYSRTPDRGSISVGKLADVILVDGDPTTNISDMRKVAMVITQGSVVSPNQVHQALGIKPFVSNPPVVQSYPANQSASTSSGDMAGLPRSPTSAAHGHHH